MKHLRIQIVATALFFFFNAGYTQNVLINEVMSSNKSAILDEDGDTPYWIELFNSGNEAVSLN